MTARNRLDATGDAGRVSPVQRAPASRSAYGRLWQQPGAPALLTSSVLGRLPSSMNALGLLLLLRDRDGIRTAALVVALFTLAFAAASPVLGRLADRHGPRSVLLATGVAHPLALVAVVLLADARSTAVVVVAAVVAGATAPPVSACARALWPRVTTTPETLATAYAADAVATEVVWIAGPLLLGLVVAVASPALAVLVAAALALVGTLAVAGHPAARALHGQPARTAPRGHVLAVPALRALIAAEVCLTVGLGIIIVAIPTYASEDATAGVLVAVWGIGSAVFGLIAGGLSWQVGFGRLAWVYLAAALVIAPLALLPGAPVVVVALLLVLAGAPIAPVNLSTYRLTAAAVPAGLSTSAFAWLTTVATVGMSAGSAVAGLLLPAEDQVGPGDLRLLYGVAAALTGLGAVSLARHARRTGTVR